MLTRTLLTGFGPFANVVSNPTQRLAERFAVAGAPGHDLVVRVLPASFERAAEDVAALLAAGGFDHAILMGVAVGASAIRVERAARNLTRARTADCDGRTPMDVPVVPGAPPTLAATAEVGPLLRAIERAGAPAVVSSDAGSYVCNHTYYAALHTVARLGLPTRCVLVHVPADEHTLAAPGPHPTMAFEAMVQAVEGLFAALADTSPGAPQTC